MSKVNESGYFCDVKLLRHISLRGNRFSGFKHLFDAVLHIKRWERIVVKIWLKVRCITSGAGNARDGGS